MLFMEENLFAGLIYPFIDDIKTRNEIGSICYWSYVALIYIAKISARPSHINKPQDYYNKLL